MPSVGISLESDAMRVVSFEGRHGSLNLKTVEEIPLEPGTIVAGELAKPEKLTATLQKIRFGRLGSLVSGAHYARIVVPEEKAYVYETVLPVPQEGDIGTVAEFSLEQNIPLAPAEAVFDYTVVGEPFKDSANNDVLSARAVVIAYPNAAAQAWVDAFRAADIVSLSIVPESMALARALAPAGDARSCMLVHFLKDKTIIAIASNGLVRFATVVAGNPDAKKAEAILAGHEGESIAESVELLAVRDEAKKVLAFWSSKLGPKGTKDPQSVKSLIVSGNVSHISDVAEYLGKHVGVPAMLANVWQNAFSLETFVPNIEFEDSLRYASAVGAALPHQN